MTQNPLMDPPPAVVGFVGLGQQGDPMAANLLAAGYDLIVRDADAERERRFVAAHGGRGCDGDPAALIDADIVITMLPSGLVVRDALLGEDGFASHLRQGTIIVDTSSSDPYGTRELGRELAELGLVLLDAPVTRPEAVGADTRRITFMVASACHHRGSRHLPADRCRTGAPTPSHVIAATAASWDFFASHDRQKRIRQQGRDEP